MLTGLSTDLFGRRLDAALRASHVDTSLVVTSARPTTLAFVELTDGQASYTFYDENTAGRGLTADQLPALPADVTALLFGGISLCSEPAADAYAALAAREAAGRVIALDPNIRPGFISDIARYRARLNGMIAVADIVKVSDEDLNWIYPGADSLADKVCEIHRAGPRMVILTRGGEGATAYMPGGGEVSVPARRVEIVDTVGAGDCFNAGVLARFSELGLLTKRGLAEAPEDRVAEALDFGARVAAVVVSRAGASPPWPEELS